MNLSKAIATASNCFINVNDRGGKPYILHCLHVMHNVSHLGDTADLHKQINFRNLEVAALTDQGRGRLMQYYS
jgi:hypothetical protein